RRRRSRSLRCPTECERRDINSSEGDIDPKGDEAGGEPRPRERLLRPRVDGVAAPHQNHDTEKRKRQEPAEALGCDAERPGPFAPHHLEQRREDDAPNGDAAPEQDIRQKCRRHHRAIVRTKRTICQRSVGSSSCPYAGIRGVPLVIVAYSHPSPCCCTSGAASDGIFGKYFATGPSWQG